jgi:hypothetical protein
MVLVSGTEDEINKKWSEIWGFAKRYPFAEQPGFDGNFKNWPNSLYELPPGNNSNTFIRYLVRKSGLKMVEMPGDHPGAKMPRDPVLGDIDPAVKPWKEDK